MEQPEYITIQYIVANYNIKYNQVNDLLYGKRKTKWNRLKKQSDVIGRGEPHLIQGIDYVKLNPNPTQSATIFTDNGVSKIEAMYGKRTTENI